MGVRRLLGCGAIGWRSGARAAVAAAMLLAAVLLPAESGWAAVLRLRAECRVDGPVVTLGDVAEVFAADAQQAKALAAVELFPSPPGPRQRFVRLREIQDVLLLRGIDLSRLEFSGSNQVVVTGGGEPANTAQQRPLSSSRAAAANHRAIEAVVEYLREHAGADAPWVVETELGAESARLVADPGRAISVTGGVPPWTGLQRFDVAVDGPEGTVRFPLDAQVGISAPVVVAARSLRRGTVIRAEDVELRPAVSPEDRSGAFESIDGVVGKEANCAMAKGEILRQESVRAPLLVRRGDVVTVYARNPGICVRTLGRARDNGSLGELVAVESLDDRSTFYARISSVREVEVYGRAARADREDIGGLPSVVWR